MMEIIKGIRIIGLSLFIEKEKLLIISDIHIGQEEALNKQGLLIPRFQFKDLINNLEKILKELHPEKIIINGDLKHEFGSISEQEWFHTLKFLDFLKEHVKEIILIKGNHDKILKPIAEKKDIQIVDSYKINDILITHGDKEINTDSKIIIIGHDHPAVSLKSEVRSELYKCFLKGKYKDKTLIVQPSFNFVNEGTDILKEKLLSPYLKQSLGNFEVFIASDKVYSFGKVKTLAKA